PLAALGMAPARLDTLGEYFVRLWLQPAAAPEVAERAAAGWRGDRIAVYLGEEALRASNLADRAPAMAGAAPAPAAPGTAPVAPAPAAAPAALAWLTAWDSE